MKTLTFYFNDNTQRLFGELDLPEEQTSKKKGIVICYPFAEERIRSHRVIYNFAKCLQSEGFSVLRFDYWGQGDSGGEWEDANIETRLSNINSAINELKKKAQVEDIALVGFRLGGTLAYIAASEQSDVKVAVLLDPILLPGKYLHDMLRSNLASQVMLYKKVVFTRDQLVKKIKSGESVNVDGFEIGKQLYDQLEKVNLLTSQYKISAKILVMQIKMKDKLPDNANLLKFVAKLTEEKKNVSIHTCLSEKFWALLKNYYPKADNLNSKTINCINEYF